MTAYTALSNALVDVGAKPFATTIQALRDNPLAISEGTSGSPVNSTGWHPVNMVLVGDGSMGRFYDFATDGALATITTPTFVDGYDYLVRWVGASPGGGTPQFNINGVAVTGNIGAAASVTGLLEILAPTLLDWPKVGRLHVRQSAGSDSVAPQSAAAATPFNGDFSFGAMGSALTSVSFTFSAQNHDAGQYYLYRRRNFMFG